MFGQLVQQRWCRLSSAIKCRYLFAREPLCRCKIYINPKCDLVENVFIKRPFTNFSSRNSGMRKLRLYKRLFAISLFAGTFMFAWYMKKRKGEHLRILLEDCTRLPVKETFFGADVSLYRYKGYVFPGQIVMSGVLKDLTNFQFRSDDIIVASFPKTGTTWIQEIVYMLTHDLKKSDASSELLETRFPYLEYPYPGLKTITLQKEPRFIKTHLPYSLLPPSFENSRAKLVYITRNPRDTAVSYFYFMRLLTQSSFQGTLSDFIKMFLTDTVFYSPFFSHVLEYWKHGKDLSVLFITYEDLHKNPNAVIKKVAQFLEVEVSEDDVAYISHCTSFSAMSKNASVNYEHWKDLGFAHKEKGEFLRKGKVGDWKSHLSASEIATFEEWERRNLAHSDFRFTYTLTENDVESMQDK